MENLRVARPLMFGVLIALGSLAPSYAQPRVAPPAPVTWLIFVDDLHIAFRDTGFISDEKLLRRGMEMIEGLYHAI